MFGIGLLLLLFNAMTAQQGWTRKADVGEGARSGGTGFSIDTKGYIGTGTSANDFWEFDPATNAWTQKANFSGESRSQAVGFSVGGKGYIGTGSGSSGNSLNDFWQYDPVGNTWTQKANVGGGGRMFASGFSIANKGYIGTGEDENQVFKSDFWEYDPAADTWTRKADYGGGTKFLAVGLSIGSKGYMGLGIGSSYFDFWEYDPITNAWTRKADFVASQRFLATGFGIGNKGYVGTGVAGGMGTLKDFWEYDPAGNTWNRRANFGGSERSGAASFSIGNKGYLGTGQGTSDFWEYDPSLDIPVPNAAVPAVKFEPIAVSTFAGNGQAGFADGAAVSAIFNHPNTVAGPDADGNIYTADGDNPRIRRISRNGVVSTIAGDGTRGFKDGLAGAAEFSYIKFLTLDSAGNIYASDNGNHAIRKITPGGMVSTLAGNGTAGYSDGVGAAAQFSFPEGLVADKQGNVYVADNNRIRKISPDGNVTSFAGTGVVGLADGPALQAQFDHPYSLCIDRFGNMFEADVYGLPRKIAAGIVTTISKGGVPGFINGFVTDKSGNLYVANILNGDSNFIYKITPGGKAAIIAGGGKGFLDSNGTAAKFYYPTGICIDDTGNIYVADVNNNRIRKLSKPSLKFAAIAGIVSVPQYVLISGNNLDKIGLSLTVPNGYAVSDNKDGGYVGGIGIGTADGNEIAGTKIYIRLSGDIAAGVYNDSMVLSSNGYFDKAALSGIVKEKDRKLVIIGSGTSACIGPNPVTDCYVNRLSNYYNQQAMVDTIIDNQLARGGTNCYNGMPSSYISPYAAGSGYVPLKDINITAALALNPDVILVNYPSNAYESLSIAEIMYCLRTIKDSANAKGVPCFITTTQPRTSPAVFNTRAMKLKLAVLKDSILAAFGDYAIDFYNGLINYADSSILYDPGDHINMNSAGHNILFQRVMGRNVFSPVPAPATGIGLMAAYFNNTTLTAPSVLGRIDPVINNDFVFKSPVPGKVNIENYSVRWTGQVKAQFSENYSFYAVTDDGVRLWVNGVLLIDNWHNQGATEKSGSIALEAGQKYDIEMEYFQGTGFAVSKLLWSSASTPKAVVPTAQLYPPVSDGAGLQGVYYNNAGLTAPAVLTRIDPVINNDFVFKSPAPGTVNVENYSVRWTGQVKPQYSEDYTFYSVTDDGVRLWVNGVLLIDNWHNQGATEKSGSIALAAGQRYNIVMEYYQATGFAVSKLLWSSASTAKSIIPKSRLFPTLVAARVMEEAADLRTAAVQEQAVMRTNIYPNPVKPGQLVSLQIASSSNTTVVIRLLASDGTTVRTEQRLLVAGVNTIAVSTGKLAQGAYIINIMGAGKPVNLKLMVE